MKKIKESFSLSNRGMRMVALSPFYALSLLPYRVLYILSDCIYIILYYIVGYRREVVRKNMRRSFPEKNEHEMKTLERKFYRWLSDYFVETLKMMSVSDSTFLKHVRFEGAEELEKCFDRGQHCAAMLGHYGNWELLSATDLAFGRWSKHAADNGSDGKRKPAVCGLIYHPLHNRFFDVLFIEIRQALRGVCIPKKDILRRLVEYRREGQMTLFGYIADQSPKWVNIHLWLNFLGQETPVFTGAERIIRKMNNAVFYVDAERPRRGQYVFTFKPITLNPAEMEQDEITRRYFEMLEESIRRDPALYLWSHDRWKRTREEYERLFSVENGRIVPKEN
ncbi:MAG: lysophospholipid acyltransferase family protein [Prevotella sp.]|uniref:lysophospholipid acyltransferase family protein n=1 Tax=Prevotella sp. TaxID=59823 RepID=UPI002A80DE87|nr:lysophospholipid acyltransferase family protein [Prevotella sp.]MDY4019446.1 lysophospholipid acyltransferase family protein [Prevotella sp.]